MTHGVEVAITTYNYWHKKYRFTAQKVDTELDFNLLQVWHSAWWLL